VPEGLPLSNRSRSYSHLLVMSSDPKHSGGPLHWGRISLSFQQLRLYLLVTIYIGLDCGS